MEVFGQLDQILKFTWSQLAIVPSQKRHPWRTAVVANLVGQRVLQRTVVLRKAVANRRLLRFYTDIRSAKIQPLPENASFSWLFYNPRKQIQVRLQSQASIVTGELAQEIWKRVNPHTFKDYATISAPGMPSEGPNAVIHPTEEELLLEKARQHFCAVDCTVAEIEFLQLHRSGHRRAQFLWEEEKQQWSGNWLVP